MDTSQAPVFTDGDSFALETRTCRCGCGEQWKALPTSPQWYVRPSHHPDSTNVTPVIRRPHQGKRSTYEPEVKTRLFKRVKELAHERPAELLATLKNEGFRRPDGREIDYGHLAYLKSEIKKTSGVATRQVPEVETRTTRSVSEDSQFPELAMAILRDENLSADRQVAMLKLYAGLE